MLGRLEMDVNECISSYSKLMESILEEQFNRFPISWTGRTKARFDSTRLKNAIEDVINGQGASMTDLFNDGSPRRCRV
jgi:hypothetical protein